MKMDAKLLSKSKQIFSVKNVPAIKSQVTNALVVAVLKALISVLGRKKIVLRKLASSILKGASVALTTSFLGGVPRLLIGAAVAGGYAIYEFTKKEDFSTLVNKITEPDKVDIVESILNDSRLKGIKNIAAEIRDNQMITETVLEILDKILRAKYNLKLVQQ